MDRLAVTSVTNFVLAGLAFFLAGMLAGRPKARWSAAWFWSGAMLCLATSALVGGIDHGFIEPAGLDRFLVQRPNWMVMGIATFCVLLTVARQFLAARWQWPVLVIGLVQVAVYAAAVVLIGEFWVVLVNYAPVMLVLLVLSFRGRRDGSGSWWMVAGIVVVLVASVVQFAGVGVAATFDHDALYHVIAMVGVILLYQGGLRLSTR